ncbi:YqaJ viral recombinase family protein [Corynebacterium sp. 239_CJEI]|uniref:YqaJ viral recombinase family protein n=1 Tax=Corynebacterium sp. 239_CJEI TaxID=2715674 RepID=UPI00066704C9|nr:YqaJ viral recombinase family protein [Corynebacterium sp. 239_CJEI]
MKILRFESEDEWLAARRQYVTATMIARLAQSRSEWQRVWDEREHGSSFHGNRYTDWGKDREPNIAAYIQMFGDSRFERNEALFVHEDGVSAATPDMVLDDEGDLMLAEIKTVKAELAWSRPPAGSHPRDFIPAKYYDQVQWQLFVTGAHRCVFAWEPHDDFFPQQIEWCLIERDADRVRELCQIRDEFLAGDWRDDARPDVSSILRRLHEVRLMKRPLDEEEQELLDELRECLGDEDTAFEDAGLKVSWTLPKPRKTWQKKAFEEAHPDLVAEFTKEVPAKKRTLRVTEVKTDA